MIDVHHHFEPAGHNNDGTPWTIGGALDEMDRNGVERAIAYAGPVFETGDAGARKAREFNDWSAQQLRDHPGRFGLFASIPMADPERALAEIAYAFDTLHADGIGIAPHYSEEGLGEPRFRPILEELDRRGAVVYVHPANGPCMQPGAARYASPLISSPWLEFPVNTARTILSLWSSKTTLHLPNVKFLFCHGGGVAPILLGRIAGFTNWPSVGEPMLRDYFPDGVYAEFRKLYFECAQAYAPETMAMLRSILPVTHILYGSDYSYFPIAHSRELFERLDLPPAERRLIAHDNAAALLSA